jgi:hypothetical protein
VLRKSAHRLVNLLVIVGEYGLDEDIADLLPSP